MKPTKNKNYCMGCHRPKMLFETQKKADNFIRYNAEEIMEETGVAPVRSYYCVFCGGWHITSNPSLESAENLNRRDRKIIGRIENVARTKEEEKKHRAEISTLLYQFPKVMICKDFDKAKSILNECYRHFKAIEAYNPCAPHTLRIRGELQQAREYLAECEKGGNYYSEEIKRYMKKYAADEKVQKVGATFLEVVNNRDLLIQNDNREEVMEIRAMCMEKLAELPKSEYKTLRSLFLKALDLILHERNVRKKNSPKCYEIDQRAIEQANAYRKYRTTLLAAIENVERIGQCFELGDITTCRHLLNETDKMLTDLGFEDNNTNLVKASLNEWAEKLANMAA
ncbi:MAG: hypothetical protein Q4B68_00990 [Bacteroidales bacterium]|nr:hypothetical protein [Bacteroidales bacterium]